MSQAKEWKVTLTGNAYENYAQEVYYIWSDSRVQAKLIAMNVSRLNVLSATASTRFTRH